MDLVSEFKIGLKTPLPLVLTEPEVYGNLFYRFKKVVGRNECFDQLVG